MERKALILKYRAKHNLTQQELADKIGISRNTLSKAENDEPVGQLSEAKIDLVVREDG